MPDWEAEEVAQFVEQIGFPQYRAAFINQVCNFLALPVQKYKY
jgi:endonuclease III